VKLEAGNVYFTYRDYNDGNKWETYVLNRFGV
jgi:hypothetical protein